jgi:hypothetical protein
VSTADGCSDAKAADLTAGGLSGDGDGAPNPSERFPSPREASGECNRSLSFFFFFFFLRASSPSEGRFVPRSAMSDMSYNTPLPSISKESTVLSSSVFQNTTEHRLVTSSSWYGKAHPEDGCMEEGSSHQ